MNESDHILYFQLLLKEVEQRFISNGNIPKGLIHEWKGADIINFQDDIRTHTGSAVSEKWFYTYVKNQAEKLPRIDILNLLSDYTGYQNWSNFKKVYDLEKHYEAEQKGIILKHETNKSTSTKQIITGLLSALTLIISFTLSQLFTSPTSVSYELCLKDYLTKEELPPHHLTITLKNDKATIYQNLDSTSCFNGSSTIKKHTLIIDSPFYKNDTIELNIDRIINKNIYLIPDDYALMLHYYTNKKVEDINRRREKLNQLIAKNAIIMEVLPYEIGVTMYDKQQFINQLLTPNSKLKALRILDVTYDDNTINTIKFSIKR